MMDGHWIGSGTVFVKGKQIPYVEETNFKILRQSPCLLFNIQQYTKHAESGNPMHAENGFLKIFAAKTDAGSYKAEASYSHPFGMNEFEFGTCGQNGDQSVLVLTASEEHHFQRPKVTSEETEKAKQVTYLRREYKRIGNTLNYEVYMGVGGAEPYLHLQAKLEKQ